ncbi:unnamed protein product [Rotaria sordida]|uniref:Kinesin light chain n=1 Tax=Rotaria sordida TaxID=392033 RepID=A0A815N254_9BILA|nr:unnamed protein product [Rotaria sordida]CAF1632670.1 unnamed protein product [Rotaria sordida]
MGDYTIALSFFQKSLDIRQKSLGEDHISFANIYDNLGSVYKSIGSKLVAQSYYQKAFDIRQRSLDENHPEMANSYNNLGTIHSSIGDKSKALAYYERHLKFSKNLAQIIIQI